MSDKNTNYGMEFKLVLRKQIGHENHTRMPHPEVDSGLPPR